MVKKLKSSSISKCEIQDMTGHASANGLDDYDSGDEQEKQIISRAIDNSGPVPSRGAVNLALQIQLHLCVLAAMFTISLTAASEEQK